MQRKILISSKIVCAVCFLNSPAKPLDTAEKFNVGMPVRSSIVYSHSVGMKNKGKIFSNDIVFFVYKMSHNNPPQNYNQSSNNISIKVKISSHIALLNFFDHLRNPFFIKREKNIGNRTNEKGTNECSDSNGAAKEKTGSYKRKVKNNANETKILF